MYTETIHKDWVGRVVGVRFRLVEWLGSSGQSGVFLCELDESPGQKAAIKLFPADAAGARSCAADWAAAAELRHPHLIRVLRTGRDRIDEIAVLYVVTEYAGEILSEILPSRPLTPAEVKEMLGPIFDALAYLHEKGFVHGRLRPSNILVVDDQLKLSVENIRGPSAIPKPPQALEVYDAPESGLGKVTPALDVWSLGVTLVEALTQSLPAWARSSPSEPLVPPSVPEPFAQIARACLRLDPAFRCTLGEIKTCLETGKPIPHRAPKSSFAKPVPKAATGIPKSRRLPILVASAVVLLSAFAIVMMHSHQTASSPSTDSSPTSSSPATDQPHAAAPVPAQSPAPGSDSTPPSSSAPETTAAPAPATTESSTPPPAEPLPAAPQETPQSQVPPPPVVQSGSIGKGAVAQQVMPDVPERAIRTIQGKVQVSVQLNVGPNGAVSDASIASHGPSRYFANLALQAARSWKFTPPQTNGQGVASVWLLHFDFRPSGVNVTSTEKSP
jgi:TonB family protein